jgi:hypothetical protein
MRSTLPYVVPVALLAAAGCSTYSDRPLGRSDRYPPATR